MRTISDHIDFVNTQIEYQDRRSTATRTKPNKLAFHLANAKHFRSLLACLETTCTNYVTSLSSRDIDPTGMLSSSELSDLPNELLNELSIKNRDPQEIIIEELIVAAGGYLSLDRILIGIYKKTNEVVKRPVLTAKLYRMVQNGQIYKEPKKRSVYSNTPSSQVDNIENEDNDSNQTEEKGDL